MAREPESMVPMRREEAFNACQRCCSGVKCEVQWLSQHILVLTPGGLSSILIPIGEDATLTS